MTTIIKANFKSVGIRCEGTRVLVIKDGCAILDLPYDAALALSKAIYIQAKKAEEEVHALDIIQDQAILTRLGACVGLTNRSDILKEAAKEAAWNSELRRYIPLSRAHGITSQEIFGTPTLKKGEAQ